MPLQTCPDCEGKVSSLAPSCPHCGRPAPFAAVEEDVREDESPSPPPIEEVSPATRQEAPPPIEHIDGAERIALEEEAEQYKPWTQETTKKKLGFKFFGCGFLLSLLVFSVAAASDSLLITIAIAVGFLLAAAWSLKVGFRTSALSSVIATSMFAFFALLTVVGYFAQQHAKREEAIARDNAAAAAEAERAAEQERRDKLIEDRDANLEKGQSLLEAGKPAEALTHLLLVKEIDDSEEVAALERQALELKQEQEAAAREKELLERARPLPASESKKLKEIYSELARLRPNNGVYQQRLAKYRDAEYKKAEAEEAAERKRQLRANADLQLLNWSWSVDHGYATAEGRVKNISGTRLENVQAVVEWETASGEFITASDALIEYNPLMADQTSPFKVMARANPQMKTARIRFKRIFGGEVPFYKE